MAALILSPFKADKATEKLGYQQGIMYPSNAENFKMVFTLLTKVVIFYIEFIPIGF